MYCAIIGDLVESRELDERWKIQEQLNKVLGQVNEKYKADIAAKFTITLGDEFQGLMHRTNETLIILDEIRFHMYPVKIRFGIGIGPMSTVINEAAAIGADGPAYYAAREGLLSIKNLNGKYVQPFMDTMCYVYRVASKSLEDADIFNATLSAIGFIANKWTDKQRDIITEVERGELSQRDIGKKLEITQSSVQRRLDSAGYYTYRHGREVSNRYLNNLWEAIDEQ